MAEKIEIVTNPRQLAELRARIAAEEILPYDTETTGLDREDKVIGFSLAFMDGDDYLGVYVILRYWDVEKQQLIDMDTLDCAKEFIEFLRTKKLIMHNAPFDCMITNSNFGVELMPSVHTDTMVLAHLLDENRACALKDLGVMLFGEDARQEQMEMRQSVYANGGVLTKVQYELYKADPFIIAKYGAKDAILTLKLFYTLVPQLFAEGLDKFFYEDETMPLLRGPTYDMNTTGLCVDAAKLQTLKNTLEAELMEARSFIYKEIDAYVKTKYKATAKGTTFNIGASQQMAWLLFFNLGNDWTRLTDAGKEVCQFLDMKMPYSAGARREFISRCQVAKGQIYKEGKWNAKTKKMAKPSKVGEPWKYISCGRETLEKLATKYKWVEVLLQYHKNTKLLSTYVIGIQSRMKYNIIRPGFKQHGTTSGRYSSNNPNFQNLPRDDKRIKACIISGPGKVFVVADYSQLEPRSFAAVSQDERLCSCFANGDDFYSVVGAPICDPEGKSKSLKKDAKDGFAKMFPAERQIIKEDVALATPYGTTAWTMSRSIGKTQDECQEIIDGYFSSFPKVHKMMLDSHEEVMATGKVYSLFGRPRRIPEAMKIKAVYGDTPHSELPYQIRTLLNLSMNHRVQSTGASIMNRAAIALWKAIQEKAKTDPRWHQVKICIQVHDELGLVGPIVLKDEMAAMLKDAMENTTLLPHGVLLEALPKIADNLADAK